MSDNQVPTPPPQQQASFWTQATRNPWAARSRSEDPASTRLMEAMDSDCLLVVEGGGSRHGQHRHRHSSSPRVSSAPSPKVRFNPLLTEAGLQLPRFSLIRSSSSDQEGLPGTMQPELLQESHNPLLSEISLRLPVSRLPAPCGRRDDLGPPPNSYVLISSDGQARASKAGGGYCCPACNGCGWGSCSCSCAQFRWQTLAKAMVLLLLVGALVALIVVFSRKNELLKLLQWVDKHKLGGAAIFTLLYTICTVLFVPVLPLAIGGGAVYGVVWGSAIVWVGATTGETAAFLIGRFLLRDLVKAKAAVTPLWQALERAIRYEGWKIILLLRLAPLVPFALINYFLGASAARFSQFFWASILGIIPGIVVNVYLGSTIRQMIIIAHTPDQPDPSIHVHTPKAVQISIIVVSAVAVVLALLLIGWYARRELLKLMSAHHPIEPVSPLSGSNMAQLQDPLPHSTGSSTGRHSRNSSVASGEGMALEPPQPVEMTTHASNAV